MTNFEDIDSDLCHYCGNCVAICPANCLSLSNHGEKVIFRKETCINCGLCHKNCPGIEFSFPKARDFLKKFCSESVKFNDFIGQYDSIFIGRAKNKEILESSSSGGLVPSILIFALEKKLIDAAVLVVKNKNSPLGYKIAIAKTKEQILGRCQSLYHMIPLNVVLKEIKKMPFQKLAFVGLPCHVEGIRKLQMNNDESAKKIKFILGIFCGLNQSFKATEFMLKNLGIKKEDVEELSYRKNGWPGSFYAKTTDKTVFLEKEVCDFTNYMFMLNRCMLCYNFTNEFADISLGDAWSKRPSEFGWSEIIARTKEGKAVINSLEKSGAIEIEHSNLNTLLNSHPGNFSYKKKDIFYRMKKSKVCPDYGIQTAQYKASLFSSLYLLFFRVMHNKSVQSVVSLLPLNFTGKAILFFKRIVKKLFLRKNSSD